MNIHYFWCGLGALMCNNVTTGLRGNWKQGGVVEWHQCVSPYCLPITLGVCQTQPSLQTLLEALLFQDRQICCQKIIVAFPFLQRENKFYAEMFRLGIPKEAQRMNYDPFSMIQCRMNLLEYTDFSITCELYGHLQLTEINSFFPMSILLLSLLYRAGQFSYKIWQSIHL